MGYRPEQPIPFSHKLHAGDLPNQVYVLPYIGGEIQHSTVPATSTCMNCHVAVKAESPKIAKIMKAGNKPSPLEWRKVHKLPDYVNFSHARHPALALTVCFLPW